MAGYWKGKHPSDETRRKMSEAQKGRKHSEETKKKISDAHMGKKILPEVHLKMMEAFKKKLSDPIFKERFREVRRIPIEKRFWDRAINNGENKCWGWNGKFTSQGYATITFNNRATSASRISWIINNGAIPEGMFICHLCDNPVCTNPKHLFLGTCADNIKDCVRKGRNAKGEKNWASKLTEAQVLEIRKRYANEDISQWKLGEEYGVKQSCIGVIVLYKGWKHVE